jgi:cell division protease FtsH
VTDKSRPSRPQREDLKKPRNILASALIVLTIAVLVVLTQNVAATDPMTVNEVNAALEQNQVEEIRIWTNLWRADVRLRESSPFVARTGERVRRLYLAPDGLEIARLEDRVAALAARPKDPITTVLRKEEASTLPATLAQLFLPVLLLFGLVWFFLFRQMRAPGSGGSVLAFGKSRPILASRDKTGITFKDVAGIEEAKEEVREVIEFLKNPERFKRLGGRIPRGMLLVGPPGCGKTLLAKAIAGEAGVPFFSICGSDFVEMFVGVGASRVRDLFKQAKEKSPCIVFLDEIDAVGRKRGSGLGGGHDEREQTLNAILVEMDGFDTDEGVIVLASTNRPDVLDPALLRPGRFDRQVTIDLPDVRGREEILKVHARDVKLSPGVDVNRLARGTPMFTGAELEAMINEGAILAAMRNRDFVGMEELEEARDKVKWGRKKTSKQMEEDDRKITAYHEAGHALVAAMLPNEVEPLHKVTIIPRGMALGATMQLPSRDQYHMQKKRMLGTLTVLFAGRIAEQLCCGDISAGASNDIERASDLARRMVCEWGMSDELGPINYAESEETLFLGRDVSRPRAHADATAVLIDREVKAIVDQCYKRAEKILTKNRDKLEALGKALLKYETLSGADCEKILRGEEPDVAKTPPASGGRPAVVEPVVVRPELMPPLIAPGGAAPEPLGA